MFDSLMMVDCALMDAWVASMRMRIELVGKEAAPVTDGPATDAAGSGMPLRVVGNTAVVSISGPIVKSADGWIARILGLAGNVQIRKAVESAARDEDVQSITLVIDSPGGSVMGLAEAGDAIFAARKRKRVVAQVDGAAASAAYYLAAQADEIRANRMDIVGSIGTRAVLYDYSRMFEEEGIEPVVIDTGKFKSTGTPGTEITDEQRADLQRIVDAYYDDFVSAVARGRGMKRGAVRKLGDGRLFVTQEAIDNGLADRIAITEQTVQEMSRRRAPRSARSARAALDARTLDARPAL